MSTNGNGMPPLAKYLGLVLSTSPPQEPPPQAPIRPIRFYRMVDVTPDPHRTLSLSDLIRATDISLLLTPDEHTLIYPKEPEPKKKR